MRFLVLIVPLAISISSPSTARCDELPDPPDEAGRLVAKVVAMTNAFLDEHVDRLSLQLVHLRVDAEQRRANVAVGGGDARFAKLRFAGNVEVIDGTARVNGRLALGVAGKQLDVQLPTVDVAPASYRGERGVELRLPLLRRSF